MEPASLFQDKPLSEQRALTIFRAAMIAREEANWKDLFAGFESLKVITYSSGLPINAGKLGGRPVCLLLLLAGRYQQLANCSKKPLSPGGNTAAGGFERWWRPRALRGRVQPELHTKQE